MDNSQNNSSMGNNNKKNCDDNNDTWLKLFLKVIYNCAHINSIS